MRLGGRSFGFKLVVHLIKAELKGRQTHVGVCVCCLCACTGVVGRASGFVL